MGDTFFLWEDIFPTQHRLLWWNAYRAVLVHGHERHLLGTCHNVTCLVYERSNSSCDLVVIHSITIEIFAVLLGLVQ